MHDSVEIIPELFDYGIVVSAFDLFHPGHMLMLRDAKSRCKKLVVGLQVDPSVTPAEYRGKKKNAPIYDLESRRVMLEGCKYVDEIFVYDDEPQLLEALERYVLEYGANHVRVLGSDWRGKTVTGQHLAAAVHYHDRSGHTWSSTELRSRIREAA